MGRTWHAHEKERNFSWKTSTGDGTWMTGHKLEIVYYHNGLKGILMWN